MMKNNFNGILLIMIISLVFVITMSVGVHATSATGGTITYDGDYTIHTFTSSGTFTVTESGDVEVLVVAGGGSGGSAVNYGGGGGGAGQLVYYSSFNVLTQSYNVVVGAGGQSSSFSTITANRGGNGGYGASMLASNTAGASGGSGGGGAPSRSGGIASPGIGGHAGGSGTYASPLYPGGGGGGAGSYGGTATGSAVGSGGAGLSYSISGSSVVYAAGGRGGTYNGNMVGANGAANRGNGGVGGSGNYPNTRAGGSGGSGIVIIRYLTPLPALEISNPQPTNNSELSFGTTSTTLGVSTNLNADCKYSTSAGQEFAVMIAFSTTGATSHSATLTGLTNGRGYDYYIKCNDTSTANITDDYHIHFNVSDTGTYNLNFGTESDWGQEDAASGTDFASGILKLHSVGGAGGKMTFTRSSGGDTGQTSMTCTDGTTWVTNAPVYDNNGYYKMWALFDGYLGTSHTSYWLTSGQPTYLTITFPSTRSISYIKTYPGTSWDRWMSGTIWVSSDGSSYSQVGGAFSGSGSTASTNFDHIVNQQVKAIKYQFTAYGGYPAMGEIEIYESSTQYPTTPYYIYSNTSQIDTSSWSVIKSITTTETTPADTSIKYLVSFDGRSNWKYWAGSAWTTSTLDDFQTNGISKTALETITENQWSSGFSAGTLDFAIDLVTTNSANTPELSGITIEYSEGVVACVDNDGDGYGAEGTNLTLCDNPTVADCNDNNADINPEAYDIVGNEIDEDCSGADADYNFSIETEFLYPSGTSTYYCGDDVWYQVTIRRDGVLYNPTEIELNLTNHYATLYDSHTKSDMTHVSVGVYKGYFDSEHFDNSVPDVRYDIWIYGDMNELLDYNIHRDFDMLDGTAPSFIPTIYTVLTNAISNYTVKDLVVNSSETKIDWSESTLDLHTREINLDSALTIGDRSAYLNSSAYSELNNSATLTFYNVDCTSPYVFYSETESTRDTIFAEDNQCLAPRCTNIQCTGNTLTVTVSSFSGYAAEADVSLTIDADDPKLVGQEVHFTADYRNVTDGLPISGAICTIYFTDGNYPMAEGAIYTYNRTFVTEGIKEYNVTCSKTGFSTLTVFDNATIVSAEIPEFSVLTLGLGLIVVLAGLFIIRKNRL